MKPGLYETLERIAQALQVAEATSVNVAMLEASAEQTAAIRVAIN